VVGACECGNEPAGYMICGETLEYLGNCWLVRKNSAAMSRVVRSVVRFVDAHGATHYRCSLTLTLVASR